MESFLLAPVKLAEPHAIPFRTIFEEHLRRHQDAFMTALRARFPPQNAVSSESQLQAAISEQEMRYADLDKVYGRIKRGENCDPTDALDACVAADRPLKALLHEANASALCLSGGGIRSASFCLGALEGLARISRNAMLNPPPPGAAVPGGGVAAAAVGVAPTGKPSPPDPPRMYGFLDGVDYLSTVSGGGYIGSWLSSWTYRRMAARRGQSEMAESLEMALECVERAQALCLELLTSIPVPVPVPEAPAAILGIPEQAAKFRNALSTLIRDAGRMVRQPALPEKAAAPDPAAVGSAPTNPPAPVALPAPSGKTRAAFADEVWSLSEAIKKGVENARQAVEQTTAIAADYEGRDKYVTAANKTRDALEAANLFRDEKSGEKILKRADVVREVGEIHKTLTALKRDQTDLSNWKDSYADVVDAMSDSSARVVTGGDPEPQTVRHLRSYTSFLAPELGATLDTSTLAAILMRNLVVNWAMLIPVLFAVVAAVRSSAFLLEGANEWIPEGVMHWLLGAFFLLSAVGASAGLPSHSTIKRLQGLREHPARYFVLPVFAGSWLLAVSWKQPESVSWTEYLWFYPLTLITLAGFGVLARSLYLTYRQRVGGRMLSRWRNTLPVGTLMTVTAATCGILSSALLVTLNHSVFPALHKSIPHLSKDLSDPRLFIVFSVPLVTLSLMAACSLFCALLGLYEMEEDREWWVRAGGWLLLLDAAWVGAHAITLYSVDADHAIWTGISGLALGWVGSKVGSSAATSAGPRPVKAAQTTKVGDFLTKHNLVLPAVSLAAVVLIGIGVVGLEEKLRVTLYASWPCTLVLKTMGGTTPYLIRQSPVTVGLESAVVVMVASGILAVLLNLAININLFSLQGMYRMRLMRAFLGASNTFRREDRFTHFDPKDTPLETDLASAPGAPLHVINTTLNLVGTTNPAWQQRKAESFTFTPIHAGSWRLGYVPASLYGGSRGVTLATAMAISGAAFNPNMGYQSSPLLSLLMTFFNLRLGYWLPNPKRPTSDHWYGEENENFLSKSGPSFALWPLLEEALGKTNDDSRWIELTDGGHFENLGLYEMVLRRVKRIIVVDAGADPEFQFEDLGNAVRKIQIDLGVPIEFEGNPDQTGIGDLKLIKGMKLTNRYCAVARIGYHCVDTAPASMATATAQQKEGYLDGYLVYIKASLTGREPVDVIQYAKTHKDSPHETTANQFFNESQFESYRKLGSYVLKTIEEQAEVVVNRSMAAYAEAKQYALVNQLPVPAVPVITDPYQALYKGAWEQWKRSEI